MASTESIQSDTKKSVVPEDDVSKSEVPGTETAPKASVIPSQVDHEMTEAPQSPSQALEANEVLVPASSRSKMNTILPPNSDATIASEMSIFETMDEEEEYEYDTAEEEQDVDAKKTPESEIGPTFMCHEATYSPHGPKFRQFDNRQQLDNRQSVVKTAEESTAEGTHLEVEEKQTYTMINPKALEYRPTAMTQFPTIIKQITAIAHAQLSKYGCQRIHADRKLKPIQSHYKRRESHIKLAHEYMDRKLSRLKIYKRAMGALIIYFRAYSPILFYIKKSYEDVLIFRLKQFKEAQHEKLKLYHERVALEHKIANYRFPDYKRLKKLEQYLVLLFASIKKQDEEIQFMTEILSKMERSLGDHFEKYRDVEDQIRLLDNEIAERMQRGIVAPKKKIIVPDEENKNASTEGTTLVSLEDDEAAEDDIYENEEIDEDKRMVLILAYSVCMKDIEAANKKLIGYETKFQNVSPRQELESTKRKITEEKSQVKVLADTLESLEQELFNIKRKEIDTQRELDEIRLLPEEEKIAVIKKKLAEIEKENKRKERLSLLVNENESELETSEEEEEDDEEEEEEEETNDFDLY